MPLRSVKIALVCRIGLLTDDVVVVLLHRELNLSTGVRVAETEDRAVNIARLKLLDQLLTVLAQTAEKICDDLAGLAGLHVQVREGGLDATSKISVATLV